VEPGVRKYLIRIVNTLSLGLLWMALNSTFGIMYDYAFVHDKITTGNIVFYIWFVLSLTALLWWILKKWSEPIDFEN
jgi:hypothetical protein